jgi:transposase-like protein
LSSSRSALLSASLPLVESGRTPAQLSREFGVTAQTISNWVAQATIDKGKPSLLAKRHRIRRLAGWHGGLLLP